MIKSKVSPHDKRHPAAWKHRGSSYTSLLLLGFNKALLRWIPMAFPAMRMTVLGCGLFTPLMADIVPLKPKCQVCTVQKEMIELGDLFAIDPQFEHYVLGESPRPGLKTLIPQSHIEKVLAPLGFSAPNLGRVTIVRDYKVLDAQKVEAFLLAPLMAQDQLSGTLNDQAFGYDLTLKNISLKVPSHVFDDAAVEALTLDPKSRIFKAQVRFKSPDAGDDFITEIEGRAYAIIEYPVLKERLNAGDVITESHITTAQKRMMTTNRELITNPKEIIGKSSARTLLPGQPLYTKDVQRPILVQKNDVVTVIGEEPGLRVTMQGQALSDGCLGDTITVRNTASKKDIGCMISGPNQVTLTSETKSGAPAA